MKTLHFRCSLTWNFIIITIRIINIMSVFLILQGRKIIIEDIHVETVKQVHRFLLLYVVLYWCKSWSPVSSRRVHTQMVVSFTKHYLGKQISEDDMDRTCSIHGRSELHSQL